MRVSTPIATIAILAAGMLVAGGMWVGLRADRPSGPLQSTGALPNGVWSSAGPTSQGSTGPSPSGGMTPGAPPGAGAPGGMWGGMGPWTPGGGPPGAGGSPGSAPKSMGGPGGSAQTPMGPGVPSFGSPGPGPGPAWGQGAAGPPKAPTGGSASGRKPAPAPSAPAPSPWSGWGQGSAAPPQMAAGGPGFGTWPGGPFGGAWMGGAAPSAGAPTDPASRALNDLHRQWGDLASAAQDVENASSALGDKSQAQVKELLERGADRLRKVSEAWRRAAEVFGETPPAEGGGAAARAVSPRAFDLIAVPAQEPATSKERAALEDTIRTRLRLLQAPYAQLLSTGGDLQELQETIRSCRDAVNRGALREAALAFNAAAALMGQMLAPAAEGQPAAPGAQQGQ